jgi:hypothetical protein
MAPEMRGNDEIRKRSSASMSDIFPCGCVFFFLLTGGKHPFGDLNDHDQIRLNFRKGEPINIKGNGITLFILYFVIFPAILMLCMNDDEVLLFN